MTAPEGLEALVASFLRFGASPIKAQQLARRFLTLGIREADIVEHFVRAQGPGGQKVNKTSSAVHLKHAPSGFELKVQTGRSQAQNRYLARRLLADRIEAQVLGERSAERQRVEKLRRQKRKRSKRAKEKMLANKRATSEKKQARRAVAHEP